MDTTIHINQVELQAQHGYYLLSDGKWKQLDLLERILRAIFASGCFGIESTTEKCKRLSLTVSRVCQLNEARKVAESSGARPIDEDTLAFIQRQMIVAADPKEQTQQVERLKSVSLEALPEPVTSLVQQHLSREHSNSSGCIQDSIGRYAIWDGEAWFDYCMRIKNMDLPEDARVGCEKFAKSKEPEAPKGPHGYLYALYAIFRQQLAYKVEEIDAQFTESELDRRACHLLKNFFKEKMGFIQDHREDLEQGKVLVKRAWCDLHFHANSLFADNFPDSKHFLPNFDQAYPFLKQKVRQLSKSDYERIVRQAMLEDTFPIRVEAQKFFNGFSLKKCGAKLVHPIEGHLRCQSSAPKCDAVGYDVCGLETREYTSLAEFFKAVSRHNQVARVHMGETINPKVGQEHIKRFLEEAKSHYTGSKPLRIGHGTQMSFEAMIEIARRSYAVEACLSSNKKTAILMHRSEYPLGLMLLLGVKVVIGTDGGKLYSTTLAHEYAHAVRNLRKFHARCQLGNRRIVTLPNGDQLRFGQIKHLVKEELQITVKGREEQGVTYEDLRSMLKETFWEKVSEEQLTENARDLYRDCYPEHLTGITEESA